MFNPVVNTSILIEARKEYTKHICNHLAPILMTGLQTIYDNCQKECETNNDPEVLKSFQMALKQIPRWNQEIINAEYDRIMGYENSDMLDDLVKAAFITNIKILSSVSNQTKTRRVQMDIPSTKRFIHKCYVESAREIYKDPFLFEPEVSGIERHRNFKETYQIICDGIEEAIRVLLPVRQILEIYLGEAIQEEENTDISNPVAMGRNNLQMMAQQEISNFNLSHPPQPPQQYNIAPPTTGMGQLPGPQMQITPSVHPKRETPLEKLLFGDYYGSGSQPSQRTSTERDRKKSSEREAIETAIRAFSPVKEDRRLSDFDRENDDDIRVSLSDRSKSSSNEDNALSDSPETRSSRSKSDSDYHYSSRSPSRYERKKSSDIDPIVNKKFKVDVTKPKKPNKFKSTPILDFGSEDDDNVDEKDEIKQIILGSFNRAKTKGRGPMTKKEALKEASQSRKSIQFTIEGSRPSSTREEPELSDDEIKRIKTRVGKPSYIEKNSRRMRRKRKKRRHKRSHGSKSQSNKPLFFDDDSQEEKKTRVSLRDTKSKGIEFSEF